MLGLLCQSCVNINKNNSEDVVPTISEHSSENIQSFCLENQEWMCNNLSSEVFQNGDSLPFVDYTVWEKHLNDTIPLGCKYLYKNENNEMVCAYLYNWYAVMDCRKLAPKGYKIATVNDFETLFRNVEQQYERLDVLAGASSNDSTFCDNVVFLNESSECKVIRSAKKRKNIYCFWTNSADHQQLQIVFMKNGHLETGEPCNVFPAFDEMSPSIAMSVKCLKDTIVLY